MYLSSFGINTLGYFNAEENERHAYHIDGDADDSNTSGKTDVLKSMIASDPTTVKNFFEKLANNLYSSMTTSMKRVEGYKSMYKVYNDKQMDKELTDYTTKIQDAEEKLNDYEDSWYSKFSKQPKYVEIPEAMQISYPDVRDTSQPHFWLHNNLSR